MALNYADRIALLAVVRSRVKAAVLNFALYILGEAGGTANHANRLAWARNALLGGGGDTETESLLPYMLNQSDFIAVGSDVTDAQITGHIETAISTHRINPAP